MSILTTDQWIFVGTTLFFFMGGAIVGAYFATRGLKRVLQDMIEEATNQD